MNVKVEADLVRKAKVVAALKKITLSSYITEIVRSRVESDLAVVVVGLADPEFTEGPAIIHARPITGSKSCE
jgi:hypothetical protein